MQPAGPAIAGDRPHSPEVGRVSFSSVAEELVRFTLAGGETDLCLPSNYCSLLLRDDPSDPLGGEGNAGVPSHPLYKHLAREIVRKIEDAEVLVPAEGTQDAKEMKWMRLLVEKGSEIIGIYESVQFELHVQEPFFSQIKDGTKVVEGRLAVGRYNDVVEGSVLLFNKCLVTYAERIAKYSSFVEMLQAESLGNVLPGVKSIEEGVKVYRKFYTEEKERLNGVLAISVKKLAKQPYSCMKELLCGLGCDVIGKLLGMASTVGTVPEGLPPARSILIAASTKPYQADVKGSSLTDAARALAKHVNRSSEGWWGDFRGSDSTKNLAASKIIRRIIEHSCWMNVHIIQPHGPVFEIRMQEGYGARWSGDGSKFIGFLEPYMPDGFAKDWKH